MVGLLWMELPDHISPADCAQSLGLQWVCLSRRYADAGWLTQAAPCWAGGTVVNLVMVPLMNVAPGTAGPCRPRASLSGPHPIRVRDFLSAAESLKPLRRYRRLNIG